MIFVNKMDIMGADFFRVVQMVKDRLKANAVPVQLPIGAEDSFIGIIDLVEMNAEIYKDQLGKEFEVTEIPADMADLAQEWREKLIESVAETDEELMMKYLEGEETLTQEELEGLLSKAIAERIFVPVFAGDCIKEQGVNSLMDDIATYFPAPTDYGEMPLIDGDSLKISSDDDRPVAFVFKTLADPQQGRISFIKVLTGTLEPGLELINARTRKSDRLAHLYVMCGRDMTEVGHAYAGDIIGVFDPGIFSIGDTITVPGKKFRYSGIPTFEPEHFMRVSPKDTMKRKQFIKGTEQIAQEGAIQIFKIPGAGLEEVIVGVVGTLQFDVFEYRMKNEYNVDLRMTSLPYDHLRLIESMDCHPDEIVLCTGAAVLQDFRDRYLLAFDGEWSVGFLTKHNPGLVLADTLSV